MHNRHILHGFLGIAIFVDCYTHIQMTCTAQWDPGAAQARTAYVYSRGNCLWHCSEAYERMHVASVYVLNGYELAYSENRAKLAACVRTLAVTPHNVVPEYSCSPFSGTVQKMDG